MGRPPSDVPADAKQETLDEAWRLVAQAITEGQLTLANGKVLALDENSMLRHIHWVASLTKGKMRSYPLPKEAFQLGRTDDDQ